MHGRKTNSLFSFLPGYQCEHHILMYHFIVLYLNAIGSVLFHLRQHQYEDILKVVALASIIACAWTFLLIIYRFASKLTSPQVITKTFKIITKTLILSTLYVQIALCCTELFLYFNFGQKLTSQIFFVLFETNLRESREFLTMYGNGKLLLMMVFIIIPFGLSYLLRQTPPTGYRILRRVMAGLYCLVSLGFTVLGYMGFSYWYRDFNPVMAFACGAWDYNKDLEGYRQIKGNLTDQSLKTRVVTHSTSETNLFVLILGESTSRHHMGLYGYDRDTTPRLTRLKDELFVFQDVISPHSHTNLVMKKLLTLKNSDNAGEWYEHPTLLTCLK